MRIHPTRHPANDQGASGKSWAPRRVWPVNKTDLSLLLLRPGLGLRPDQINKPLPSKGREASSGEFSTWRPMASGHQSAWAGGPGLKRSAMILKTYLKTLSRNKRPPVFSLCFGSPAFLAISRYWPQGNRMSVHSPSVLFFFCVCVCQKQGSSTLTSSEQVTNGFDPLRSCRNLLLSRWIAIMAVGIVIFHNSLSPYTHLLWQVE